MRIAVLSDIHDHVWNLTAALASVASCDTLICCGDLCSPFVLDQLARGFERPIHIVFGNNDADLYRITSKAPKYPHVRLRGEFFEEDFEGRRIAVNHFDNIARAIAAAGAHDAVFYGHNHVYDQRVFAGRTLALNPGSLMGAQFDASANRTDVAPTWAVYDTGRHSAEGFSLMGGSVARLNA
jgi:putative phosphoesterase